ncbi:reductase [Aspergillus sp. HF37]|nr:reductase [Aspergillus sp. HF37]
MPEIAGKEVGPIGFGLVGLTWRATPPSQEQALEAMRAAILNESNCWNGWWSWWRTWRRRPSAVTAAGDAGYYSISGCGITGPGQENNKPINITDEEMAEIDAILAEFIPAGGRYPEIVSTNI